MKRLITELRRGLPALLALPFFTAAGAAQGDAAELQRKLEAKLGEAWIRNAGWITDFDQAKAEAKRRGTQIFGYFTRSYLP